MIKRLLLALCLVIGLLSTAQTKKPEYQIIIDGVLATEADVEYYAKQGRIKSMNKGVSDAEHKELVEKYGDIIGDAMFIMSISLHPEESYTPQKTSQWSTEKKPTNYDNFMVSIGKAAPDVSFNRIDGSSLQLSELKGKVVLINFWATWCAPCIMEFYELPEHILEPFKDQDFIFIPIAIGESESRVRSMMTKLNSDGINFNTALDPKKELFKTFAQGAIPKSIVIDKKGVVRILTEGNPDGQVKELAKQIEELLK